jgi:TonB family protein
MINGQPGTAVGTVMVVFRLPQSVPQATVPSTPPTPQNQGEAKIAYRVMPVYPPLALQARIQGVVTLTLQIGSDGAVAAIQMISGHPLLQQSSVDAIRKWHFEPPPAGMSAVANVAFNYAFVNGNPTVGLMANTPEQGIYSMTRLPDGTMSTSSVPGITPPPFRAGRVVVSNSDGKGLSDENIASTLQRCAGCSEAFVEGITGVIGTRLSATFANSETSYRWPGVPSVIFRLASNGTDLEMNCAWHEECTVTSTFANGTSTVQTLGRDQSAVVSASAQISVTYRN